MTAHRRAWRVLLDRPVLLGYTAALVTVSAVLQIVELFRHV